MQFEDKVRIKSIFGIDSSANGTQRNSCSHISRFRLDRDRVNHQQQLKADRDNVIARAIPLHERRRLVLTNNTIERSIYRS